MSNSYIQNFAKRFKELNTGVLRLLIVIWGIILIIGLTFCNSSERDLENVGGFLILLFILYWFIIRIGLWVKDGFDV